MNIGIKEDDRKRLAQSLSTLLADSYTLYLKTHNFHWNVKGPMFHTLHVMLEEHYQELATAVDDIAERIRALGERAPGSYKAFGELTSLKEATDNPKATEMIQRLVDDHETLVRTARSTVKVADETGDEVTADMATERLQIHEKTAWMLRSLLEE